MTLTNVAISTLINDTESSFRAELAAAQNLIDTAQSQLRDVTSTLTSERRTLADLEARALTRQLRDLRIANLRQVNDAHRSHLATTGPPARQDVSVGDADSGLEFDMDVPAEDDADLTPDQAAYLDALPSARVLEARARAYATHNAGLDAQMAGLRGKSFALEKKLRKLIALSTGTAEDQVDVMLGPLRDAVESEGGEEVDYLRLREFLRKIG